MSNKELITVLIPIFNKIDYLKESIDSIVNQTYKNLEIICLVDYSKKQKEIVEILNSYKDKRIKIITFGAKVGLTHSLNIGLDESTGKYIARMDDDDISVKDRFEKEYNFLEKNKDVSIVGSSIELFGVFSGINILPCDYEILKVWCLFSSPLMHPTVMMRKCDIDKHDFRYDEEYVTEDYELWSRIIGKLKIANLDEVLLKYRTCKEKLDENREVETELSHLKIIQNQLKNYLNLELPIDEVKLISKRGNYIEECNNKTEILKKYNRVVKKIIKRNKKIKFYNQDILKSQFIYYTDTGILSKIKIKLINK